MTEPSLDGVWAKLARAKTHRDALEAEIGKTFTRDAESPQIGLKFDHHTGKHVLYVSRMPDFAELLQKCALIGGDILNNLRSTLDHLVYQLAVKCTKGDVRWPDKVQFPICDFRRKHRNAGFLDKSKTYLREVRGYRTRIEKLQPYPRRHREPNRSLAILRDLNNRDKHRLLVSTIIVPKGFVVSLNALSFQMLGAMSSKDKVARSGADALNLVLISKPIELGTELDRLTLTPDMHGVEIEVIGQITPAVSFGEDRQAIRLCDDLIAAVEQTVGIFEDAFQ